MGLVQSAGCCHCRCSSEFVEVVDHAIEHTRQVFLQLDLALSAFFEHLSTGALEVLGLRCYEAAVDVVLFAVAENFKV